MMAQLALFHDVVIVGFKDTEKGMKPVSKNGVMLTFDTKEAARDAAGLLGCACPVSWQHVKDLCERWGLEVPS